MIWYDMGCDGMACYRTLSHVAFCYLISWSPNLCQSDLRLINFQSMKIRFGYEIESGDLLLFSILIHCLTDGLIDWFPDWQYTKWDDQLMCGFCASHDQICSLPFLFSFPLSFLLKKLLDFSEGEFISSEWSCANKDAKSIKKYVRKGLNLGWIERNEIKSNWMTSNSFQIWPEFITVSESLTFLTAKAARGLSRMERRG
jgi:hypothetical protein